MIILSKNKIDIDKVIEAAASDQAGAIDVFIGTVRNQTKNKKVIRLEFEAYESMAIKELELIKKSLERHQGKRKLAAAELGISERTLYRKIKQFDL